MHNVLINKDMFIYHEGGTLMKKIGILFILLLSFVFISCGGNGGGNDDPKDTKKTTPNATLDPKSAQAIAGISLAMRDVSGSFEQSSPVNLFSSQSNAFDPGSNLISEMLDIIRRQIIQGKDQLQALGSNSKKLDCNNGGSITLESAWDGPEKYSNCSEVSDISGKLEMDVCQFGNVHLDGSAKFSIDGSLCAPTSLSLSYSEWNVQADSPKMSFNFPNLSIKASEIQYLGDEITYMKMLFNGGMESEYRGDLFKAEFNNYTLTLDATNPAHVSLSISGSFRGECMDGWVSITTSKPIVFPGNGGCPVDGELKISGNGDMVISFNADGSVDVGDNHFTSCNKISSECKL